MRRTLATVLACILSDPLLAQSITAFNTAGERLATLVDIPAGAGPFPALVLAPGQGYHMGMPVLDQMAQAFVTQGYAVFRFNWSYYSAQPRRQPSADLSQELQELRVVIAAARQHPKVLPDKISVGGKSLGSLVAWQAFRQDPALRSVLLLTPVCSRKPAGQNLPV
ncbi:MAG: alpha/beta hydrolase family protein, partial [Roseateles sp.]